MNLGKMATSRGCWSRFPASVGLLDTPPYESQVPPSLGLSPSFFFNSINLSVNGQVHSISQENVDMCVYSCMHAHEHSCTCMFTLMQLHECAHSCAYVCTLVSTCTCSLTCLYARALVCACMCAFMCLYVYARSCACTHMCSHVSLCVSANAREGHGDD